MSDQFEIEVVERREKAAVIRLSGSLEVIAADALKKRCTEVKEEGFQYLALDMSDVGFIASSGVGVLLALTEEIGTAGGTLFLTSVPPAVESVITMLNLDRFLAIYPGVDDALAYV